MKMKTVLMLKAVEESSLCDPYFEKLHKAGIASMIIPTLDFVFINEEILKNCLLCSENFSGIIFTSPRTVQAVQHIFAAGLDISKWKKKKNFAVGEATSKLAASLLELDLLGETAGSGEELCKVILSSADREKFVKPFLFPCSQKSKDTVTKILTENGLEVKRVICYKTECSSHLEENLEKLITEKGIPDIIVFFSPSGVEFSNKILKKFLGNTKEPQFIAIGPTTEQAIKNAEMNLCRVAEKPNPDSVLEAVKSLL